MVLVTRLPNPSDPALNLDDPCAEFGWPNMVTRDSAQQVYYPEHAGALSIKCAFNGEEIYEAGKHRFAVDDGTYLILNEGQRYASHIQSPSPVESFCIFFRKGMAEQVLQGLVTPADRLLDDPAGDAARPVEFFEALYPHDRRVTPVLEQLRHSAQSGPCINIEMEPLFHLLLENMLLRHRDLHAEIAKLPPVRWSTKIEIYTRLHRAREFMDASYAEPITLNEMARVACLSPYYFLRLFKQAFQQTPHQYLTRKRLEHAQRLLRHTDQEISAICLEVGFQSFSSFSQLFRNHLGVSPQQFRKASQAPRIIRIDTAA